MLKMNSEKNSEDKFWENKEKILKKFWINFGKVFGMKIQWIFWKNSEDKYFGKILRIFWKNSEDRYFGKIIFGGNLEDILEKF